VFGFHGILPIAAPLLVTATVVTATGAVTFDATTVLATATVSSTTRGGLLMRRIPPRYLVTQNLLRRRNS
jgi:hypothetical protein